MYYGKKKITLYCNGKALTAIYNKDGIEIVFITLATLAEKTLAELNSKALSELEYEVR